MYINKKVKIKHQNPPPFRKAKHIPPQKNIFPPVHTPSPSPNQNKSTPLPTSAVEIQPKHNYASQNSVA